MNNPSRILFFVTAIVASSVAASAADGQQLFLNSCVACHGADGKGLTPAGKKLGAKDLTQSTLGDGEIEKQIATGDKDAKGKSRMPAFGALLSPEDTAALVAYVKSLRH